MSNSPPILRHLEAVVGQKSYSVALNTPKLTMLQISKAEDDGAVINGQDPGNSYLQGRQN